MYIYQSMSNNFGYIDIILLAMIAGFIILRLRNILGRKTGHESKVFTNFEEKDFEKFKEEKTVPINKPGDVLDEEQKKHFLQGAEIAYESIITSFANGNKKKLQSLLSPEMILNFEQAISERERKNIKSELTFIGIKNASLEKYEKVRNDLYATVKFVSEIISVKRDESNNIIDGNPDVIKTVTDQWKFTRNAFSKNSNWYLSEIVSK